MLYTISKLEPNKIAKIQSLENDLGKTVLAFSPLTSKSADLTNEELAKIQKLENELAISLVAVTV